MKKTLRPWIIGLAGMMLLMGCASENSEVKPETSLSGTHHSIINGTRDTLESHKAVVSVFLDRTEDDSWSTCTGTLIHPQWVITAAHCVAEEGYYSGPTPASTNQYIKIGVGNDLDELKANLHEVSEIYFNDQYGSRDINYTYSTIAYDVALIKLKEPIPADEITPIPALPSWLGINRAKVAEGVDVEFIGYGYDENGEADVKLSFKDKLTSYCGAADNDPEKGCEIGSVSVTGCHPDKSRCDSWYYYSYCTSGYLCLNNYWNPVWLPHGAIYFEKNGGGTCNGDSGGPALITIDGKEYVAGLTSYGDVACAKIGVSTAVQDYFDWILERAPEVADMYADVPADDSAEDADI